MTAEGLETEAGPGGHSGPDAPGHDHSGHDHSGHGDHHGHAEQFRRLFWVMLALAVPMVLFSEMFAHLIGYHLPEGGWVRWVSPLLGTVMYAWGGMPFLTGAVDELRAKRPGMMVLVALAITVAFSPRGVRASSCSAPSSTSGGNWRCWS